MIKLGTVAQSILDDFEKNSAGNYVRKMVGDASPPQLAGMAPSLRRGNVAAGDYPRSTAQKPEDKTK